MPPRPHRPRRIPRLLLVATAAIALAGVGVGAVLGHGSPRARVAGTLVDRVVPRLSLEDESGRTTSLGAFRGRVVVFAPFLTLCHEVCPLTTGAFERMRSAVAEAGLGGRVAFAEISVDPWRDTPARLRAFARLTGARFHLLTGTRTQLARFWRFFGVAYYRVREGRPPDTDWLTNKPLAFDVGHTDGLFLVDARGRERIVAIGTATAGRLPRALRTLLNGQGRHDLAHPAPGWTVAQGLDDVGYLVGRRIPDRGS